MAAATLSTFIRDLSRAMAAETLSDRSDRELVEQFLAAPGEAIFVALVRRHGPMVYRVCWRVLQQEQDAEDAFQATFLVLAQKLQSVRKRTSLASWLHGVAHRVALKAKAQAALRRRHEKQVPVAPGTDLDALTWREIWSVLDAELVRLPEKWRVPLVLCYLEGRTQDEAAVQLGWSKNTLRRRLEEARTTLGLRLGRRGVALPTALSTLLISDSLALAALPSAVAVATAAFATRVAAGDAVGSVVFGKVAALVSGAWTTMAKIKLGILLLASLFGASLAISAQSVTLAESPKAQEKGTMPELAEQLRERSNSNEAPDILEGRRLMTLPAGFQHSVLLRKVGDNLYSLQNAVRFSGTYARREARLVLVGRAPSGDEGFEWEMRGDAALTLVLVNEPPAAKTGQNYRGAILRRASDDLAKTQDTKNKEKVQAERTEIDRLREENAALKKQLKDLTPVVSDFRGVLKETTVNVYRPPVVVGGGASSYLQEERLIIDLGKGESYQLAFTDSTRGHEEKQSARTWRGREIVVRGSLKSVSENTWAASLLLAPTSGFVLPPTSGVVISPTPTTFQTSNRTFLIVESWRPDGEGKDDQEKLQGTWRMVGHQMADGGRLLEGHQLIKDAKLAITGNKAVFTGNSITLVGPAYKEKAKSFEFELDHSNKHGEIHFSNSKEVLRGIFQVSGDDLKLCFVRDGEVKAPTDFKVVSGSKRWLYLFHRERPNTDGGKKP